MSIRGILEVGGGVSGGGGREVPHEEGDAVRKYEDIHEEDFWSNWPRMDGWIHCNKESTCANGTSTELPGYWQNSRLRIHTGNLAEGKCYLALRRTSHALARERDHLESKTGPPESRRLVIERVQALHNHEPTR